MTDSQLPEHRGEPPWAKYFIVGVSVTILDILLYPYLRVQMSSGGSLHPYILWGTLLFFLIFGTAIGYLIAWKRRGGYGYLVPSGAVMGLVLGYELSRLDPTLTAAFMVGVAASGLSVGVGSLLS